MTFRSWRVFIAVGLAWASLLSPASRAAETRSFVVGGASLMLEDVSGEVQVLFRALRFIEADEQWHVEMVLTNAGSRRFAPSLAVSFESVLNATGPLQTDGLAGEPPHPFVALREESYSGPFLPGQTSVPRTLALGYVEGAGAPRLTTRVFAQPLDPSPNNAALALTRSLNEAGQPLPGVSVIEQGPQSTRALETDPEYGVVTLGQIAGAHTWRFESPGRLPAWRKAALTASAVRMVASPRLPRRSPDRASLVAGAAARLTDIAGRVQLDFAPGGLSQNAEAVLTVVDGQTLPGPLPQGWSPLNAFWIELTAEPVQPIAASLRPADPLTSGETTVLARWNETNASWQALQLTPGHGSDLVSVPLPGSGAYVLVVADTGPLAPRAAVVGQVLPASTNTPPPALALAASGSVTPAVNPASTVPQDVTGAATVIVTNRSGPFPSGTWLRCDVREDYRLQDGGTRLVPRYESVFFAYQRPGDDDSHTVQADFSMRPRLLFGPGELVEAKVTADVLPAEGFAGGLLEPIGNTIQVGDIRLTAQAGAYDRLQAVLVRTLDAAVFSNLVSTGTEVVIALDVTVAAVAPGKNLALQVSNLAPNQLFVLARVISDLNLLGLEPVERLQSGTNGLLASLEPGGGERLPGLTKAGQYLLVRVAQPQTLLSGTVRGAAGQPTAGSAVRVASLPWLALSSTNGSYRLVAPTGAVQLAATDLATGQADFVDVTVPAAPAILTTDLTTTPHGPRVSSVTPPPGTRNVSRVTPVVVNFTKPINPATLLAGGLQLLATNGAPVPASLNLNLRNTVATLLPSNPLQPQSSFTVVLSSNITDLSGLRLEGPSTFTFTTESDQLARASAQLIMFEPGATNIPAEVLSHLVAFQPGQDQRAVVIKGTAGAAEPERPVILVNETSGETSTVLSQPDGGFYGFIAGDEDDFVSATIVNANGTLNYLPVSRQQFDNGFVGLFSGGGILEAQNEDQRVEVIVEPGSIQGSTKFRLNLLSPLLLQQVLAGLQPAEGGKVLQGFTFEAEGDPLQTPADVRLPIDPANLGLPAGVDPTNGVYALTTVREVNGVRVFEMVDSLEFRNGFLESSSPPFPGLGGRPEHYQRSFQREANSAAGSQRAKAADGPSGAGAFFAVLLGFERVLQITGAFLSRDPQNGFTRPVAGGVVFAAPASIAASAPSVGATVSLSDSSGVFATKLVVSPGDRLVRLAGISDLFPNRLGIGSTSLPETSDRARLLVVANVIIERGNGDLTVFDDTLSPSLSVSHGPTIARTNSPISVQVLASDNVGLSQVTLVPGLVEPLSDTPVTTTDVAVQEAGRQSSLNTERVNFTMTVPAPARVLLEAKAIDVNGNQTRATYKVVVGAFRAPTPFTFLDLDDTTGPMVLSSDVEGVIDASRVGPIRIRFSEPIAPGALDATVAAAITLNPSGGQPFATLEDNARTLVLRFPALTPNTLYTLTVSPASELTDLAGNVFDQDPGTPFVPESHTILFQTKNEVRTQLAAISAGGGIVGNSDYLFAVDRADSRLRVFQRDNLQGVGLLQLPPFPRDIVYIGTFDSIRPGGALQSREYVAICGGLLGLDVPISAQHWLVIVDVTNPNQPVAAARTPLSASPTAAITKLAWSPPILGFLLADGERTVVDLVDFQLLLFTQDSAYSHEAHSAVGGFNGVDENEDGDYADPLDVIPLANSELPVRGIFNGGLVSQFSFPETPGVTVPRINDFALGKNGSVMGVVYSKAQPSSSPFPGFLTVNRDIVDGQHEFSSAERPDRVFLLFDVPFRLPSGDAELGHVALVSEATSGELVVLDITDPIHPFQARRITLPQGVGQPKSAVLGTDGLIYLACSQDMVVLEPTLLKMPPLAAAGSFPAIQGVITGMGNGARSFVASSPTDVAVSHGSRFAVVRPTAFTAPLNVVEVVATDRFPFKLELFAELMDRLGYAPPKTRVSSAGVLEIVRGTVGAENITDTVGLKTLFFDGTFIPNDLILPPGAPLWTKNSGEAVAGGRSVEYSISGFDDSIGSALATILLLGNVTPNANFIRAEMGGGPGQGREVVVRVFPSRKVQLAVDPGRLIQAVVDKTTAIKNALQVATPIPLVPELEIKPPRGRFAFESQWQECPTNHLAFYAFKAQVGLNPAVDVRFGVKARFPGLDNLLGFLAFAGVNAQANVFAGFRGVLTVQGALERKECGQLQLAPIRFETRTGILLEAKVELGTVLAISLSTEAALKLTGQASVNGDYQIRYDVAAAIDPALEVRFSVAVADGLFEFTGSLPILPPVNLGSAQGLFDLISN